MTAYNKILLATQTINWLAYQQSSITSQLRVISGTDSVLDDMVKRDDKLMDDIVDRLTQIANELGDYMNSHDSVSEDDESVTGAAFQWLNAARETEANTVISNGIAMEEHPGLKD